jgi:transposase
MLSLSPTQRIYLAIEPVDMRKQCDGLWALVTEKIKEDPFSGALFVFINKNRNLIKILCWDGSGVWVMAKRLGKSRFSWPTGSTGNKLAMEPAALTMLLAGIDLKNGCKKAWFERLNH